jgi:hypothetical protein
MRLHTCQNCTSLWRDDQIKTEIPDIQERVSPGEPMPSGECPECGALCHEDEKDREFDVHIFAVVRIKVQRVKAPTYQAAIAKAIKDTDLYRRCMNPDPDLDEYAEENSHYLVDVRGDEEYAQSQWFADGAHKRSFDTDPTMTQVYEEATPSKESAA